MKKIEKIMFNIQKLEKYLLNSFLIGTALALLTPLFLKTTILRPFVFSKAFAFQIVVLALAILWAVLMAIDWQRYRPRFNLITGIITAFVGIVFLSSVFGLDFYRSFWGNAERMDGFLALLYLYIFFLSFVSVLKNKKEVLKKLIFVFILGGFLSVLWVIGQKFGIIRLPDSESLTRPGGLLGNPAFFSGYLLVCLFLSVWYFITGLFKEKVWRITKSSAWAIVFIIFNAIGLIWTQTRGSWLGLLVGGLVFLIASLFVFPKRIKVRAGVLLVAVIVLVGLFIGFQNQIYQSKLANKISIINRLSKSLSVDDSSGRARLWSWQQSIGWAMERPILGVGQDMFYSLFDQKYNPNDRQLMSERFDRAHNKFIDVLVMNGILGLVAYLLLLATMFWLIFRAINRSQGSLEKASWLTIVSLLTASIVHNFFVFETPVNYLAFFFVLAWLVIMTNDKEVSPSKSNQNGNIKIFIVFIAVVLITGVVFYNINYKPYKAGRLCYEATAVANQLSMDEVSRYYKMALSQDTFLNSEVVKLWSNHFLKYINYTQQQNISIPAQDLRRYTDDLSIAISQVASRDQAIDFYVYSANIYAQLSWMQNLDEVDRKYYFNKSGEVFNELIKKWPSRVDYYIVWLEDNLFRKNYDLVDAELISVLEKAPKYGRAIWLKSILEAVKGNFINSAELVRRGIINKFHENWRQSNTLGFLTIVIPENNRASLLDAWGKEFDNLQGEGVADERDVLQFADLMSEMHQRMKSRDFVNWAKYLKIYLEANENDLDAWVSLAVVSAQLHDKTGALLAAKKAAELDPAGYGKDYQSFADIVENERWEQLP